MKQDVFSRLLRAFLIISFLYCGVATAGQWTSVCVEGTACSPNFPSPAAVDRHTASPLPVGRYIWFQYSRGPQTDVARDNSSVFRMDTLTGEIEQSFDQNLTHVSDKYSIGLPGGTWLSVGRQHLTRLSEEGRLIEMINWSGETLFDIAINEYSVINTPVERMGVLYTGYQNFAGSRIYHSTDSGQTWIRKHSDLNIGNDRYNLMINPEQTGLWAISSRQYHQPKQVSLWESFDDGATWTQIDNGSFPESAVRIVHDPENPQISYALASEGLYISTNRGIDWQSTLLVGESVHGMVFADRISPRSRALVVGTDSGVKISIDGGSSWLEMSGGLLNIPHTVTYHNGVLIATSNAGYFTCNTIDCAGIAQDVPRVAVTEFYNTELGHYFITPSEEEANGIDQGSAGPGWVRTGETFQSWNPLEKRHSNRRQLCRFYGSVTPGPNSHFFTISNYECNELISLERNTPATEPRWNFEQHSFMASPPSLEEPQPCPDDSQPVYRAYNGGFARGEDSNHRYVTDPALLEPMVLEGWVEEGVVFCVAPPAAM